MAGESDGTGYQFVDADIDAANQQAEIDYFSGRSHMDISGDIELRDDVVDTSSLYEEVSGGFNQSQTLKQRVGLAESESYTDYANRGGVAPSGFELAAKLQVAQEKRKSLHDKFENGEISETDFLFQAYGKDILKSRGEDLTSVNYWYNRKKNGQWDSPLDNPYILETLISESREQYEADTALRSMNEDSAIHTLISGQELTEEQFESIYSSSFRNMYGEEYNQYIKEMGGYSAMLKAANAGYLDIDRFIDNNGDGEISDGDFFFHDNGRVYKIGEGCTITKRDGDGNPVSVQVGAGGVGNVVKTLAGGILKGIANIFEIIPQIAMLALDLFDSSTEAFAHTKKFTQSTEEFKNKLKIGNISVFNDNYWTSTKGFEDSTNAVLQVADGIGTVGGFLLTAWAGGGIAGATSKAMAKTTQAVVTKAASVGAKSALKATTREVAKTLGAKEGLKYFAVKSANVGARLMGGFTKFNNGVVGGANSTAGGVLKSTALTKFGKVGEKLTSSAIKRNMASSAILTTRDFIGNLAQGLTVNDYLPDEEKRSNAKIFGDAAAVAAVNWAITSSLRASWDDVGFFGRVGEKMAALGKAADPVDRMLTNRFVKWACGSSMSKALADVGADSLEMILTTINNNLAISGGVGKTGALGQGIKDYFSSPGQLAMLIYSGVSTYKGFGKNNYGTKQAGIDTFVGQLNTINTRIDSEMSASINAAKREGKTAPDTIRAAESKLNDYRGWISDGNKLLDGFGMDASGNVTSDGRIVLPDGKVVAAAGGDLTPTQLTGAQRVMYAVMRLNNETSAEGVNTIIKKAVSETVQDSVLKVYRTKCELAFEAMRRHEDRMAGTMGNVFEGTNKVTETANKLLKGKHIDTFFDGLKNKKWGNLATQAELDDAMRIARRQLDLYGMTGHTFVTTETYGKFAEDVYGMSKMFDPMAYSKNTAELTGAKVEQIDKHYPEIHAAIMAEIDKSLKAQGIIEDPSNYYVFLMKEHSTCDAEEQKVYAEVSEELEFMQRLVETKEDQGFGSYFVVTTGSGNSRRDALVVYDPNMMSTLLKNTTEANSVLVATKALKHGDAEDKIRAFNMIVEMVLGGGQNIDKLKKTNVDLYRKTCASVIEECYTTGRLTLSESMSLLERAIGTKGVPASYDIAKAVSIRGIVNEIDDLYRKVNEGNYNLAKGKKEMLTLINRYDELAKSIKETGAEKLKKDVFGTKDQQGIINEEPLYKLRELYKDKTFLSSQAPLSVLAKEGKRGTKEDTISSRELAIRFLDSIGYKKYFNEESYELLEVTEEEANEAFKATLTPEGFGHLDDDVKDLIVKDAEIDEDEVKARLKRKLFFEKLEKNFPEAVDRLNYIDSSFITKLKASGESFDKCYKAIQKRLSRVSEIRYLTSIIDVARKVEGSTTLIKKSNIMTVDLSAIKTSEYNAISEMAIKEALTGIADEHTVTRQLSTIADGSVKTAINQLSLDGYIQTALGKPILKFDMSVKADREAAYEFLEKLGYEPRKVEEVMDIDGVYYDPNAERGFIVDGDELSARDLHLEFKMEEVPPEIKVDVYERIYSRALNQVVMDDSTFLDVSDVEFVFSDLDTATRTVSGSHTNVIASDVKSGKLASKAKGLIKKYINVKTKIGDTDSARARTLRAALSILEAIGHTRDFLAMGYDQAKEPIIIELKDAEKLHKDYGYDYIKVNDGKKTKAKLTGLNCSNEQIRNILDTCLFGSETDALKIFPIDQNKKLEDIRAKVTELGIGIYDQETLGANYTNYLYTKMSATADNTEYDTFNTLQGVIHDVSRELYFNDKKPEPLDFSPLKIKSGTVGSIKEQLSNEKLKDNFFAIMLGYNIRALEEISGQRNKNYDFLADKSLRDILIDGIDKGLSAEEITEKLRVAEYVGHGLKEEEKTLGFTKEDNVIPVGEKSLSVMVNYKDHGFGTENKGITGNAKETVGVAINKETFDKMKEVDVETIKDIMRSSYVFASANKPQRFVDEYKTEIDSFAVYSVLEKSKHNKVDGGVEYHLSTNDIIALSDAQLDLLIKTLAMDRPDADNLREVWRTINGVINKDVDDMCKRYGKTKDELFTKIKKSVDTSASSATTEQIRTTRATIRDGKTTINDQTHDLFINRAILSSINKISKTGRKKLLSSITQVGGDEGLQYHFNKTLEENVVMTNLGSRTSYDLNNRYQAYKVMQAYINSRSALVPMLKSLGKGPDEVNKKVDKLAMEIISNTTGVSMSDGYVGTFFIDKNGDATYGIRHGMNRGDGDVDSLLQYELMCAKGNEPKCMIILEKDEAVEAGGVKVIELDQEMRDSLHRAFVNQAVKYAYPEETIYDYYERQTPHVRNLQNMYDSINESFDFTPDLKDIMYNCVSDMANSFNKDTASLGEEAAYNAIINKAAEQGITLTREDFKKEKNLALKNIQDAINFGVAYTRLPGLLRSQLDIGVKYLCSRDATDVIARHKENKSGYVTYNKEKVSLPELLAARVAMGKSGATLSFLLKAIGTGLDGEARGLATEVDGSIETGYSRYVRMKKEGYEFWDAEWATTDDGRKYLASLAIVTVDPDSKVSSVKEFQFNVVKAAGFKTVEKMMDACKNFVSGMTSKFIKEDGCTKEEAFKRVKAMFIEGSDTKESVADYVNTLRDKKRNILMHNGKGSGADLDTIKESGFDDLYDYLTDNTKVDFLDTLNELCHTTYIGNQKATEYENLDGMRKEFKDDVDMQEAIREAKAQNKIAGDAHTAGVDALESVFLIDTFFKGYNEDMLRVVPQKELFDIEIKKFLKVMGIELTDEEYKTALDEAYNLIALRAVENKELYSGSEDIILKKADYKQMNQEQLRKCMNVVDGTRRLLDKKTQSKIDQEYSKKILKENKAAIERTMPHYDEAQRLLLYIAQCDTDIYYQRMFKLYYALQDMYGEINNYETGREKYLPRNAEFDALMRVFDEGNVEEFLKEIDNSLNYDEYKKFSGSYAELNRALSKKYAESENKPDRASKEFRNLVDPQSLYTLEVYRLNNIITNITKIIGDKKTAGQFEKDIIDFLRDSLIRLSSAPVEEKAYEINNVSYSAPALMEVLEDVLKMDPDMERAYLKATPFMPGSKFSGLVYTKDGDIKKQEVVCRSDTVIMSKLYFEKLFKQKIKDIPPEMFDEKGFINVAAERHPADKGAVFSAYKVLVMPEDGTFIRMSPLAIFSNHFGDFDGDNLVILRPNEAQSRLFSKISKYQNAGLNCLDDFYYNAVSFSKQGVDNSIEEEVIFFQNHGEYNKFVDLCAESLGKLARKEDTFKNITKALTEKIESMLPESISKENKDDLVKIIINHYGIERCEEANGVNFYLTKNDDVLKKVGSPLREVIESNRDKYIRAYFAQKNTIDAVASVTGMMQELLLKVPGKAKKITKENLTYRQMTISENTEMLLRRYYDSLKKSGDIRTELKKSFESVFDDIEVGKQQRKDFIDLAAKGFDEFMYCASLIDEAGNKKANGYISSEGAKEDLIKANEETRKNIQIRSAALSMLKELKKDLPVLLNYSKNSNFFQIAESVYREANDIDRHLTKTDRDGKKVTPYKSGYVFFPVREVGDDYTYTSGPETQSIYMLDDDIRVISYKKLKASKFDNSIKRGEIFKKDDVVYGYKVPSQCIVTDRNLDGEIILAFVQRGSSEGMKVTDAKNHTLKAITSNDKNEYVKNAQFLSQKLIRDSGKLPKDGKLIAVASDYLPVNKHNKLLSPIDSEHVIPVEDNGKTVGYMVYTELTLIEDATMNNVVKDGTFDDYTIMMSGNDATSLVTLGGQFMKIDKNGDIVLDDSDVVAINNYIKFKRNQNSDLTDGTAEYQILLLASLMKHAPNMSEEDKVNITNICYSDRLGSEEVFDEILNLMDTYYKDGFKNAGLSNEERALFNADFFRMASGMTVTGLEDTDEPMVFSSKNKGPMQATSKNVKKSFGRNTTAETRGLEKEGTFSKGYGITKKDLINQICISSGKGIITEKEILALRNVLPRGESRADSLEATKAANARNIPTVYTYDSKTGQGGTPEQIIHTGESSGRTVPTKDYIGPRKVDTRDPEYTRFYDNVPSGYKPVSALKAHKMLKFFCEGSSDTAYDRAKYFDATIADRHLTSSANRRVYYKNGELFVEDDPKSFYNEKTMTEIINRDHGTDYKNIEYARSKNKGDVEYLKKNANTDFERRRRLVDSKFGDMLGSAVIEEGLKHADMYKDPLRKIHDNGRDFGPFEIRSRQEDDDSDITCNVKRNRLWAFGIEVNDDPKGGAILDALSEARSSSDDVNVPKYFDMYRDTEVQAGSSTQETMYDLSLTCPDAVSRGLLDKFVATRGMIEAINSKEISDAEKATLTERLKTDLGFETKEEATKWATEYAEDNKLQVYLTNQLSQQMLSAVKEIELFTGAPNMHLFNYLTPFSSGKDKTKKGKQGKVLSAVRFAFGDGDMEKGDIVSFLDSASVLCREISKTQAIIRMANKLPKNNVVLKSICNAILDDAIEGDNDIKFKFDASSAGGLMARDMVFLQIMQELDISVEVAGLSPQVAYKTMYRAVKDVKASLAQSLGLKPDANYSEICAVKETPENKIRRDQAIKAEESLWVIRDNLLATSPELQKRIVDKLKNYDGGYERSTGKALSVRLVDRTGRIITANYDDKEHIYRRPLGQMDLSYIKSAVEDGVGYREKFERNLALRAISGDIYMMDRLLAEKLEKNIFTTKVPSRVQAIIQKTSRWGTKLLMSQPLKLLRRLMQFTAYDLPMAMTVNPNTWKYMPQAKREISAFMQSKGAVLSRPEYAELRQYLIDQGFKYSDIASYDPIQMDNAGSKTILDKAYFDKVNKLFSAQNLLVRYALYKAQVKAFDENDPYYGVLYRKKNAIDAMESSGKKAIATIDGTLGGPGGFSELSKDLASKGFVFTTFPLAVARWGIEGAQSMKKAFNDAILEGYGPAAKNLRRTVAMPLATIGGTYAIIYCMIGALCELFDVDEEDAKEMALKQEFIDPINTILNNGIVTVDGNSIWQYGALIDSVESAAEADTLGKKAFGFFNDNIFSHVNPLFKNAVEIATGVDMYGSNTEKNDYTVLENAERKLLGYVLGAAGANQLISSKKYSTGDSSLKARLTNVLSAELGSSKAYKSDKKSYDKALGLISGFNSITYDNKVKLSNSGSNYDNVSALAYQLKKAVTNCTDVSDVYDIIRTAQQEGYTEKEIKQAIRRVSVCAKIEQLGQFGKSEIFWDSLDESGKNLINRAIQFEQAYFPYLADLITDDDYSNYYNYNRYYPQKTYSQKRYNTYYRDLFADDKKQYIKWDNRYDDNDKLSIDDLFVARLSNYTGYKALDMDDLIGDYRKQFPEYDKRRGINGEYYDERRNQRSSQSDWRN